MPAKKIKQFCSHCGKKVDMGSRHCNHCGVQLPAVASNDYHDTRQNAHQDLAHPINQQFRDYLHSKVLDAYHTEKEASQSQPRRVPVAGESDEGT
jgi:predicted amidophosphoribosyltransferase